jgi:cyclase
VVAAVDVRRLARPVAEPPTRWQVHVTGGREPTALEGIEWMHRLQELGAGEILLTSMDRDGTQLGYDLELLRAASGRVRIPVIASGGAGNLEHLAEALEAGAHGVLAASIFHYQGRSLPEARAFLRARGFEVRP